MDRHVNYLHHLPNFFNPQIACGTLKLNYELVGSQRYRYVKRKFLLTVCAQWEYPFKISDLPTIVQEYLNSIPKIIPQFRNNRPVKDWGCNFLNRYHEIKARFAENVKYSRVKVSPESIKSYFKELKVALEAVEPKVIVNYDETCFIDDPGRKNSFSIQLVVLKML